MSVLDLLEQHKKVVDRSFALVGMRVAAAYTESFGKIVNNVKSVVDLRRGEIPNQVPGVSGVGFMPLMPRRRADEIHTYYVGVMVDRIDLVPERMEGFILPAQRYVAYQWQGDDPYLDLNRWMDEQGFKGNLGSGYTIELYVRKRPAVILTAIDD